MFLQELLDPHVLVCSDFVDSKTRNKIFYGQNVTNIGAFYIYAHASKSLFGRCVGSDTKLF